MPSRFGFPVAAGSAWRWMKCLFGKVLGQRHHNGPHGSHGAPSSGCSEPSLEGWARGPPRRKKVPGTRSGARDGAVSLRVGVGRPSRAGVSGPNWEMWRARREIGNQHLGRDPRLAPKMPAKKTSSPRWENVPRTCFPRIRSPAREHAIGESNAALCAF